MQQFQVNSELIELVTYEPKSQTLHVRFTDKGEVVFSFVGADVVNGLLSSNSKDDYFKKEIMANSTFRKRHQIKSKISKSLFQD
ncbi:MULTISPECIES: KTSC domain-containing protein [Acinetobacter calcoaceticus/baumannii complex]|uniref:KTSC domain-containing protein n=1 Tax=Acinetobacter calcoaceticus/baumannii complex TaxID=909768 RepID=UPI000A3C2B19|nr:KTSC domain-containing protein [Acinetobacter baumannii]MDR8122570.1 hypothetical protein [Acinetobacter baumannii]MDR8160310.1 hypothetical protein [Acinetobacter baumannii]OTU66141.1 hypothetical protein CAT33_10385 [Acinetobacter baumannii]